MFGKIILLHLVWRTVGNIQTNWQYVGNCYTKGILKYICSSSYIKGIRQKLTSLSCAQWHFKQWFTGIFSTFMGTLGKYLFYWLEFICIEGHNNLVWECRTKVIEEHESWGTSNTLLQCNMRGFQVGIFMRVCWNLTKAAPWRGLVMKSATISFVGQYFMDRSP